MTTSPSGAGRSYNDDIEGNATDMRMGIETVVSGKSRRSNVRAEDGITIQTEMSQYEDYPAKCKTETRSRLSSFHPNCLFPLSSSFNTPNTTAGEYPDTYRSTHGIAINISQH
jgi:hypothetical protein